MSHPDHARRRSPRRRHHRPRAGPATSSLRRLRHRHPGVRRRGRQGHEGRGAGPGRRRPRWSPPAPRPPSLARRRRAPSSTRTRTPARATSRSPPTRPPSSPPGPRSPTPEQAVSDATLRATIAGTVTAVDLARATSSAPARAGAGADTGTAERPTTGTRRPRPATISIVVHRLATSSTPPSPAADVEQLEEGLQAEITATGVTDTVYGTVSEVGLVAQTNDSGAAVFPVTIAVTGKQQDLYAGVSADASIIVKQIDGRADRPQPGAARPRTARRTRPRSSTARSVKTRSRPATTYGMSTEVTVRAWRRATSSRSPASPGPTGGGGDGERPAGRDSRASATCRCRLGQLGGRASRRSGTAAASERADHRAGRRPQDLPLGHASSSRRCAASTPDRRGGVRRRHRPVRAPASRR